MASRPVWEGHPRLSLVTCPVALHKATQESRGAVRFHLLNPATHNRVKQAWKDAAEDTELDRRDLVRGYEVEKDTYVVVEEGELKALKLESTKVIDIEKFVEARAIDRLYWDQPYYLVPDGKPAAEPYAVIREAMQKEGQVALGRLVMASRERVVAIEVRRKGMLLTTLRSREEVREAAELFDAIPEVRISPRMVEIAKQIIAQAEGAFDPAEFRDRYEEALRELVERKAAGARQGRRPEAPPEASNVIDLMDALRRSLKGGGAAGGRGRAANDDPRAEAAPRTAAAGRKPHRTSSRGDDEGGDTEAEAAPARPRRQRQGGSGATVRGRPRGAAEAAGAALGIAPGWDRRPGALGLVVLREPRTGARVLGEMRWGLRPGGRGRAARLTHARAETIAARPAFRDALNARRFCLVPMDGYVQRASRGGAAGQCFAVALADGAPMAVAGLWDEPDKGAAAYAIVTCAANAAVAPIHDRMPVVLGPEAWPVWLARQAVPLEAALALLRPCPPEWLRVEPLRPAEAAAAPRAPRPARPARVGRPAEQMRLLGLAEPAPPAAGQRRGPPRAAAERQRPMARRASR